MVFIFWLLIMQPVIDLITSLSNQLHDNAISIGALARTGIMLFLFIYIAQDLLRKKSKGFGLFISSFIVIGITFVVNILLKEPIALFQEVNFAFKTSYFLVMVYTAIIVIKNGVINKAILYQAVKFICLIVGISYWLAIITNTSINSYTYDSRGYSGWFYAANELSVIVIILLGISIVHLRYDKSILSWLAFILMLSMVPMIGTKTTFLGGSMIISLWSVYLLFKYKWRIWKNKSVLLFFGIILLFICMLPLSPITSNTEQMVAGENGKHAKDNNAQIVESNVIVQKVLSSRNVYFQATYDDYTHATPLRKAFGLGYAGDYEEAPKVIEMDFFDLFFSYGIVGSLFLLLPLILLSKLLYSAVFPLHMKQIGLCFTIIICFGIAFLAGHVIFAPSVMTYVLILFILLGVEKYDREYHRTRI